LGDGGKRVLGGAGRFEVEQRDRHDQR
jgi:hypothetical protein